MVQMFLIPLECQFTVDYPLIKSFSHPGSHNFEELHFETFW